MIQTEIINTFSKILISSVAKSTEGDSNSIPSVSQTDYAINGYHVCAKILPNQLLDIISVLDKAHFFIESITGVDWIKDKELEVVYDFSRFDFDLCRVVVKVRIPRETPVIPSISQIYTGANWHEREAHDFFGITFENHPNLSPLLLPEDADFHPLLKDFKQ